MFELLQSVKKTGRVIIAHEAPMTNGFGAEVTATIQVRSAPWSPRTLRDENLCYTKIASKYLTQQSDISHDPDIAPAMSESEVLARRDKNPAG